MHFLNLSSYSIERLNFIRYSIERLNFIRDKRKESYEENDFVLWLRAECKCSLLLYEDSFFSSVVK